MGCELTLLCEKDILMTLSEVLNDVTRGTK